MGTGIRPEEAPSVLAKALAMSALGAAAPAAAAAAAAAPPRKRRRSSSSDDEEGEFAKGATVQRNFKRSSKKFLELVLRTSKNFLELDVKVLACSEVLRSSKKF
eukprot:gene17260-biopygen13218